MLHLTRTMSSCTAQNSDLDGGGGPRAHAHTEQLRTTMDPRTVWDEYGIVADVEVSGIGTMLVIFDIYGVFFSRLLFIFLVRIYMS